ncbi:unnamed protein product [Microthlaspi erraticum]|uniref:Uncharacterized protein n=1 Tax=Microthlaspi erraticum TaxID=1685480 RepID=A0A6D2JDD9_9BRAS|nr:unnamed protein product [Microthlaspi erraticum]
MDFIKTSSLRALIELTFQRNWNGLIWMSRKGVTTKRVKTVQTALSRKRPTAQSGWPRNECSARPNQSVRLKSRPKFKPPADHASRPGKHVPRSAKPRHSRQPRTTMPREPGSNLAAAQPSAYHGRCAVRAGKLRPASGRESSANLHRPTTAADHESVRPRPFRLGHDPIPADRPDRPSQRRGRPEARFEARFIFSRPGLTLSRL